MTDQDSSPHIAALQELQAALDAHRRVQAGRGASTPATPAAAGEPTRPYRALLSLPKWRLRLPGWRLPFNPWFLFDRRHPVMRTAAMVVGGIFVILFVGAGALWWRLSSGPIMLDLATPWLTAAIEQNLGSRYRVEVGGTQLERDAQGRTALRLRDIVLRDASGVKVAVAPKAEVGISGTSLLFASPRAESFRLVGAQMTVRIDPDGRINILVGGDKPFVTVEPERGAQLNAPAQKPGPPAAASAATGKTDNAKAFSLQAITERGFANNVTALLAWIDEVGKIGLDSGTGGFDGQALNDIGITNASLSIDDRRSGSEWKFSEISLKLNRPKAGGVALNVLSESKERPWAVGAALTPSAQGHRRLQFEARKVVVDDLLALRMSESKMRSDTQISASIDTDIAADGTPETISGSIFAEGGSIGNPEEPDARIPITSAEFGLDWSAQRRTLRVPFKVTAGAARYTLRAEVAAPAQPGGNWAFALGGGWIVLDPIGPDDEGLVLKRVVMRGNIDPAQQRITLEQGDLGTKDFGGGAGGVTVAMSGKFDYSGEPRLALGVACNPMPAVAMKRLWPAFLSPKVRDWVIEHIASGNVERIDIATNATIPQMQAGGPPMPEEGLSIEMVGSAATIRPVAGLPSIHDADLTLRLNGRTARITMGKGIVDVSPGRRLTLSNGVFDIPNIRIKQPPARVSFRVDGPVPAAAELLTSDRLRDFSTTLFDPASTRGNVTGLVQLGMPLRPDLPPGSTDYDVVADLNNFSADKMLLGQKVEAQSLRVTANNQAFEIKGDVKVGGAPAQVEYRKLKGETDAEVKVTATLDEAARTRFGLDVGPALAGPMPVKLNGRLGDDREGRFNVEADLTNTKIENALPGWIKATGRPARLAFTLVKQKVGGLKFDDVLIDGQGALAKGTVELDTDGELLAANFPVFATADGDKAAVRIDRGSDGAMRVVMRGDVYDGRNFIKAALGGPGDPKIKAKHPDLDLDIKLGVVAGNLGETVRGLEWRMSRRGGRVRTFSLNAKIGRDTPLIGEMRTRVTNGKPVLYFETNDAGALFRFTDMYQRMVGGRIWVGMDPPTQDGSAQDGIVNISSFSIRGDSTLDRVVSNAPNQVQYNNNIEFSQARADFTRAPGRMTLRDGVLRGPMLGATVEGNIDYVRDQVAMRGTLVPLYGLNNMFGQIPIVGMFLGGGSNEGMFGITYEVSGTTSNPRPVVNPISAIAPGVLRKFFEFREVPDHDRAFADPAMR